MYLSAQVGWSTQTAGLVFENWSPSLRRWLEIHLVISSYRWDFIPILGQAVPAGIRLNHLFKLNIYFAGGWPDDPTKSCRYQVLPQPDQWGGHGGRCGCRWVPGASARLLQQPEHLHDPTAPLYGRFLSTEKPWIYVHFYHLYNKLDCRKTHI